MLYERLFKPIRLCYTIDSYIEYLLAVIFFSLCVVVFRRWESERVMDEPFKIFVVEFNTVFYRPF